MDHLLAILTALLVSLPAWHEDTETLEERTDRMGTIASAVLLTADQATCSDDYMMSCTPVWPGDRDELAILLVTLAWYESRLSERIHSGLCRPGECDYEAVHHPITGKLVSETFRARTMWQMHYAPRLMSRSEWNSMSGQSLEATATAAWAASKLLGAMARSCKTHHPNSCILTIYAGAKTLPYLGAKPRLDTYRELLGRYQAQKNPDE